MMEGNFEMLPQAAHHAPSGAHHGERSELHH